MDTIDEKLEKVKKLINLYETKKNMEVWLTSESPFLISLGSPEYHSTGKINAINVMLSSETAKLWNKEKQKCFVKLLKIIEKEIKALEKNN